MKMTEMKKGYTDGFALMVLTGETEWAERIDAELKKEGYQAGCQETDDDVTEITYGVKRSDVPDFKKAYMAAKKATK